MGQRHQAFLIARISNGKDKGHYRCLAAFHHHYCEGSLPLRATRRFLTLAKQPMNAAIIREELRRLGEGLVEDPETPSHYLSSLLGCAFNFGLEEKEPYISGQRTLKFEFLPATKDCWYFDNNEGLSIIDITDPERGAYCFLTDWGPEIKNAEAYVRRYHEEPDSEYSDEDDPTEKDVLAAIESLADIPLITVEALAETWPESFQEARRPSTQEVVESDASPADVPSSGFVPTLTDLTLLPGIKYALTNHDIQAIENILRIPGKEKAILDILKSSELNPLPDAALPLLTRILDQSNEKELDFSHYPLTDDQILFVLSKRKEVRVLNISYNPNVTINTVRAVLSAAPSLRRLVLFGTNMTKEEWNDLLTRHPKLFYHLDGLIHPRFYEADKAFYPSAFTFILRSRRLSDGTSSATLPFFTPTLVIEALSQAFTSEAFIEGRGFHREWLRDGAVGNVVLSHEVLGANQSWGERIIPFFAPPISESLNELGGWTFCMAQQETERTYDLRRHRKFKLIFHIGFIKMGRGFAESSRAGDDEDAEDSKIAIKCYDLTGFLSEMEKEGRPKAPEHAVKTLTEAFAKITNPSTYSSQGEYPDQWFTQEEAEKLFGGC